MVFSSLEFIFVFLPVVMILYALFISIGKRFFYHKTHHYFTFLNSLLLIASLFFYIRGEKKFFWVMMLSSFIDYFASYLIGREYEKNSNSNTPNNKQRWALILSLTANLGLLCFFKYANWGYDVFLDLLSHFSPSGISVDEQIKKQLSIVLPIGISFYTFQTMSYTIDVYRRQVSYSKNLIDYLSYVTFFPQLIAGPIVRYIDVQNQLSYRTHSLDNVVEGFKRFTIGLSKKVLIANPMGYYADYLFALDVSSFDAATAWVGAIAYTLQIYFDFSGYSDMAIGLGRIFGFHFPENFNYPYIAQSVQDFWRRWHMSLSTWFRDYLYIPLGGNRLGVLKEYRNLFAIFIICGLWHGANYTFVLWGAYHGLFLTIERIFRTNNLISKSLKYFKKLASLYTLIVIIFGWVLFRADNVEQAMNYWCSMLGKNSWWNDSSAEIFTKPHLLFYMILGVIFSIPINRFFGTKIYRQLVAKNGLSFVLHILLFAITSCVLTGQDYNPFIYFRF
jgi:alginate O-acetyltransferase complex protein AlgI